jgi:hypothetical protein
MNLPQVESRDLNMAGHVRYVARCSRSDIPFPLHLHSRSHFLMLIAGDQPAIHNIVSSRHHSTIGSRDSPA